MRTFAYSFIRDHININITIIGYHYAKQKGVT